VEDEAAHAEAVEGGGEGGVFGHFVEHGGDVAVGFGGRTPTIPDPRREAKSLMIYQMGYVTIQCHLQSKL
jgi:hypothetical protein